MSKHHEYALLARYSLGAGGQESNHQRSSKRKTAADVLTPEEIVAILVYAAYQAATADNVIRSGPIDQEAGARIVSGRISALTNCCNSHFGLGKVRGDLSVARP